MSLHRITAGSGYDYLTRQVAAMDSTEKGHTGLASYYSEKGEVPGRWTGSGMAGIDGLNAGDIVTAEQMQSLFGSGHHPLAAQRRRAADGPGVTEQELIEATRLGKPFPVYDHDITPFRIEVARRLEALNRQRGLPRKAAVAIEDRAQIRSQVARVMFRTQFGRDPLDARELAAHVARLSRQQTTAVAGFDLTFSPVKSVSALWALADPPLAAAIERAHHAAVADALRFVERRALFTRTGKAGIRQVEVRGLVAAAFTHRDSRAGDPDLHTHVAVANKLQTVDDGRWLAIDGRVLFKAAVTASETYNTRLERHLTETLGVQFAARPDAAEGKRPIREIVGVPPELNARWSTRRVSIAARQRRLAAQFQADHGRPPTAVEAIALAQQATLETRYAKHEPRSLAEQRTSWRDQARQVLGGDAAIRATIRAVLHPAVRPAPTIDADWMERTARIAVATVQAARSTWQVWHVRAEALRAVRAAGVPSTDLDRVVDELVAVGLRLCVRLDRPAEPVAEPAPLQRSDGTSVYTVKGAQLFTSKAILAAEQRLVDAAGRTDGRTIPAAAIDLALLESEANGVSLNTGQMLLVRAMATSGRRLQLAIAPAGSGKTTAMNTLSRAWTNDGGTVLGLAPSAAAASALGDQLDGHTDTLAKLAWHLHHGDTPTWMDRIRPDTLVIIDEAGMADTLTLVQVVSHVLTRGGSVRLVGDDQQLAAIGAGGVLRDIDTQHGALRLTDLVRFTHPAEGGASLALRAGRPDALGFYLDQRRIHVGGETTMADQLFAAWAADRASGLDAIMLAPTRELVADLNLQARTHRLADSAPGPVVDLADGNQASVGEVILTRRNDRRLRTSATDWVKNGDRWTIHTIQSGGAVDAVHTQSGRHVRLPADYVRDCVELGYACTTHSAQGVTADTCHGLLTGEESRQQAYTMLTRGRHTNNAHLVSVGDGDPHTLIRPDTINPPTPTDALERILACDDSPVSATSQLRDAANPAHRLSEATARYSDAVGFAAAHHLGETGRDQLESTSEALLPGITRHDTWPALRHQLQLTAADGRDPAAAIAHLSAASLEGARDPCAVLARRLAGTRRSGPLPWLETIPHQLADHPIWGPYLTARRDLITDLATQVRTAAATTRPAWTAGRPGQPDPALLADVEVWRAATGVPTTDLRPTGEPHTSGPERDWQQRLDTRLHATDPAAYEEWLPLLHQIQPTLPDDPFAPVLAARLGNLAASGINTQYLVRTAAAEGPLPDDHAAAALWWRIAGHLPAVATTSVGEQSTSGAWLAAFTQLVGEPTASLLQDSPWWPALSACIDRGLQRGWPLATFTAEGPEPDAGEHADPGLAWLLRIAPLTDRHDSLDEDREHQPNAAPADLYDNWTPNDPEHRQSSLDMPDPAEGIEPEDIGRSRSSRPSEASADSAQPDEWDDTDQILAFEALVRTSMRPPDPTDADIRRQMIQADQWRENPTTPARIAQLNQYAADFYQHCLRGSWAQPYLASRFHADLTGHPDLRPGYAPDAWTALVQHLRHHGVTDQEMVTAGLATVASTGRLIDRFRDRVLFPIRHDGQVLGFVGRRHPNAADDRSPKYLNTPDTPLYRKGDQLFVAGTLAPGMVPVVVEGPMDAVAVTLATDDGFVGVAPLGTSLTETQVVQLRDHGKQPIIATDNDPAGRKAAERDYWLLTPYLLDPRHAELPDGTDPADLVADGHEDELAAAIRESRPLAEALIDRHLTDPGVAEATLAAVRVLAAAPPEGWNAGAEHIAERTGVPASFVRAALASTVKAWIRNRRKAAQQAIGELGRADYQAATWVGRPSQEQAETIDKRPTTPVHRADHESSLQRPVRTGIDR